MPRTPAPSLQAPRAVSGRPRTTLAVLSQRYPVPVSGFPRLQRRLPRLDLSSNRAFALAIHGVVAIKDNPYLAAQSGLFTTFHAAPYSRLIEITGQFSVVRCTFKSARPSSGPSSSRPANIRQGCGSVLPRSAAMGRCSCRPINGREWSILTSLTLQCATDFPPGGEVRERTSGGVQKDQIHCPCWDRAKRMDCLHSSCGHRRREKSRHRPP
jgi:hypothetical protein